MTADGPRHLVRHTLTVGVMLDDVGFRHLLSSYVDDLRERFPDEAFEDDTPNHVLDSIITRLDPVASARSGGAVFDALADFCQRRWRLDLAMTASDFGDLEKREGPYRFDRAQYHLGRRAVSAAVESAFPSTCPFRRSRHLSLAWARAHREQWPELLPDSLWWAVNNNPSGVDDAISDDGLGELSERLEASGFELESLGLYLTTLETVHASGESLPA